jgi:hypothetical protein
MGRKGISGMSGKLRNILLYLCLPVIIYSTACTGQRTSTLLGAIRGRIDLKQLLSWLPADTETLLVANGPFWMSTFQLAEEDYKDREVTNTLSGRKYYSHLRPRATLDLQQAWVNCHLRGAR